MKNGSNISYSAHKRNCRDHRSSSLPRESESPSKSLGKRPAAPETNMDEKKKARHSNVVKDTVLTMMDSWLLEENNILSEDMEEKENQLVDLTLQSLSYQRQAERLQRDFNVLYADKYRLEHERDLYRRQHEELQIYIMRMMNFCPHIEQTFPGDFDMIRSIQAFQRSDLRNQMDRDTRNMLRAVDPDLTESENEEEDEE